jgi:hypothetical protein
MRRLLAVAFAAVALSGLSIGTAMAAQDKGGDGSGGDRGAEREPKGKEGKDEAPTPTVSGTAPADEVQTGTSASPTGTQAPAPAPVPAPAPAPASAPAGPAAGEQPDQRGAPTRPERSDRDAPLGIATAVTLVAAAYIVMNGLRRSGGGVDRRFAPGV